MAARSILFLIVFGTACGCRGTSKYGMDDPDYAAKYNRPYDGQGDKFFRMGKQMVDARHVARKSGGYLGAGAGLSRHAGGIGAELGGVYYPNYWLSTHLGVSGMLAANSQEGYALLGVNGGVRAQTPTRLAPFVGVGAYGGAGRKSCEKDIFGNEHCDTQGLLAVYPEVGLHYWCTGRVGLSVSSQFWQLSSGDNFWYHGLMLTVLEDTKEGVPRRFGPARAIQVDPPGYNPPSTCVIDGTAMNDAAANLPVDVNAVFPELAAEDAPAEAASSIESTAVEP